MKKFVIGFLAGAFFATSATAFASDVVNMIGKKVQAVNSVTLSNGTKVGDGIIVDNKTYAPVRAIGEAAGFTVNLEGKDVILDSSTKTTTPKITMTLDQVNAAIESVNQDIDLYEKSLERFNTMLTDPNFASSKESTQRYIDAETKKLDAAKARLAELQEMKAKLEAGNQ